MKRGRIFFLSLPAPSVTARAIIADPPPRRDATRRLRRARTYSSGRRSTREFDTFPSYEKRAESTYFHVFFLPQPNQPARPRRHSDGPPSLSSYSLRFNSPYFRSSFVALFLFLFLHSFNVRLSRRLRLFHSPPTIPTLTVFSFSTVSICPSRSSQPPFTRSLMPSALDVPISFARKQCCGHHRAYTLFSLNKFNLNFPAVRNVY